MPDHTYTTDHEREAFELGTAAGLDAASWVADGNTSADHVARVLAMMDAGDPEVEEYLPTRPNLSGEWAEAPTPRSLFSEIVGEIEGDDPHPEEIEAEIADDIGAIEGANRWPNYCIDWERAARELAQDYTTVEWEDATYYAR